MAEPLVLGTYILNPWFGPEKEKRKKKEEWEHVFLQELELESLKLEFHPKLKY